MQKILLHFGAPKPSKICAFCLTKNAKLALFEKLKQLHFSTKRLIFGVSSQSRSEVSFAYFYL